MEDDYIETHKTSMTYEEFVNNYAAEKFKKTKGYSSYVKKYVGDLSPDEKYHVACSTGKIHPTKGTLILIDGRRVGIPQKTLDYFNEGQKRPPRRRGSEAPSW